MEHGRCWPVHKAASRHVLIVEGNPDGHRLYYASLLVKAASQSGDQVTVATTSKAVSSPEWSIHMGPLSDSATVTFLTGYSPEAVSGLANDLKIDHVVIPDGDSFAYELSKGKRWSGRGSVTALVMREKGQPSMIPGVAPLKTFMKGILLQLADLRPRVEIRVLKSATWRGFSMLPISRDPVTLTCKDTTQDSEELPLLDDDSFWFGVVGGIGYRKNLPLVAAAIGCLNRADVGLLVAGQIEAGVLERAMPYVDRIRDNGGRVKIIDRLLGESEFDQVIAELDCVVLAHSNDGPSGILGKAVAAGTRIVAAGASTLRSDCRHIGAGAEWARLREQHLSQALARATDKPRPEPSCLASSTEFTSGLLGAPS